MRGIKFRGKEILSGKMVYGSYVNYYGTHYISPENDFPSFEIDPETVGQFTGIKDTNGKEIYEGDILKFETVVLISKTLGEIKEVAYAVVKWAHQGFALDCVSEVRLRTLSIDSGEVVGNIFENPELIAR